jgi:hypothetical protein
MDNKLAMMQTEIEWLVREQFQGEFHTAFAKIVPLFVRKLLIFGK